MNQFTFEAKQRTVLGGMMIVGLLCLVITYLGDDALHSRFWSNFLHNSVFFTGIAFLSLFVLTAFTTAYAGWHAVMKRVWEAYMMFLIPGLVLIGIVIAGLYLHAHHLYHWADEAEVAKDEILQHKSSFLNKYWYGLGSLVIMGVWIYFATQIRKLSLQEDAEGTTSYTQYRRVKVISAIFLPIGGFTSAAMVWQWIMSVDSHWYSTLFAWYTTASWFVAMMALTIMTLIYMKSKGYFENVRADHFHDLGKYLFAFSVFWTYLWFSQYMLIWYANVGEETIYFRTRINEYPAMFYGNLIINFVLPFFILLRNDTKRKAGTLFFVAFLVFVGHWWDFFLMIKPGVLHTTHAAMAHGAEGGHAAHGGITPGFSFPGLLELGTMLGFLGGFLYFVLGQMTKASLQPKNDPYIAESLQHHV